MELLLPAYTTATATWVQTITVTYAAAWSNTEPVSEARDRTLMLTETSWILHPLSHNENSYLIFIKMTENFPKKERGK